MRAARPAVLARTAAEVCAARTVSAVAAKNDEFLREAFFRQAWADAVGVLSVPAEGLLQRVALVLFKPEALVAGRVESALTMLREHGFAPIAWRWVGLTRHSINIIWRFQWNVATLDRLALSEDLYCQGRSLVVAFGDDAGADAVPSSIRLRAMKGAAQPELRSAADLRSAMRSPNRTMTLIHAADEPIDIVREIVILFSGRERAAFLREIGAAYGRDRSPELLTDLRRDRPERVQNELDWHSSFERLVGTVGRGQADRLIECARELRSLGLPAWPFLVQAFDAGADAVPLWDRLVIGATIIAHDVPNERCTIDDDGVAEWKGGLGRMVALPCGQRTTNLWKRTRSGAKATTPGPAQMLQHPLPAKRPGAGE